MAGGIIPTIRTLRLQSRVFRLEEKADAYARLGSRLLTSGNERGAHLAFAEAYRLYTLQEWYIDRFKLSPRLKWWSAKEIERLENYMAKDLESLIPKDYSSMQLWPSKLQEAGVVVSRRHLWARRLGLYGVPLVLAAGAIQKGRVSAEEVAASVLVFSGEAMSVQVMGALLGAGGGSGVVLGGVLLAIVDERTARDLKAQTPLFFALQEDVLDANKAAALKADSFMARVTAAAAQWVAPTLDGMARVTRGQKDKQLQERTREARALVRAQRDYLRTLLPHAQASSLPLLQSLQALSWSYQHRGAPDDAPSLVAYRDFLHRQARLVALSKRYGAALAIPDTLLAGIAPLGAVNSGALIGFMLNKSAEPRVAARH